MPITKRLYPYDISSQLQLRPLDPFDPSNEELDLSWLVRPDSSEDELLAFDLSGPNVPWRELTVKVEATLPKADLERVLPPPSSPESDAALVVAVHCPTTKLREATILTYVEGRWEGEVHIRRAQTRRRVTLVPQLVRTTDLPTPNDPSAEQIARERGLVVAEGRGVALVIDATERPLHGLLRTSWEDFRGSTNPWRKVHDTDLFHLDVEDREPMLWLNSRHEEFRAALHSQVKNGGDAVIRHLGNAMIAQMVWLHLFSTAVAGLSRNAETGIVERPDEPWKRAVLATLSTHAFRGLSEEEQLRRLDDLRSAEHAGSLVALLGSAAQSVVKSHQLLKRAINAAERSADLGSA